MSEELLGGSGFKPATEEEKRRFKKLVESIPDLTDDEWRELQRIEWSLTKSEYVSLKFPNTEVKDV